MTSEVVLKYLGTSWFGCESGWVRLNLIPFAEGEGRKTKMESCNAVEREVDRVLSKFGGLRDHSKKNLEELISSIQNIQRELNDGNHF